MPIIALISVMKPEVVRECKAIGFDGYITKPIKQADKGGAANLTAQNPC